MYAIWFKDTNNGLIDRLPYYDCLLLPHFHNLTKLGYQEFKQLIPKNVFIITNISFSINHHSTK